MGIEVVGTDERTCEDGHIMNEPGDESLQMPMGTSWVGRRKASGEPSAPIKL